MIKRIIVVVLLLISALFCGICAAEECEVTVMDTTDNHNPLANVQVQLISSSESYTKTLYTQPDGKAIFSALPAGLYTLIVSKDGYVTQTKSTVIDAGFTKNEALYLAKSDPIMIEVVDESTLNPIPEATVIINGETAGITDNYGRLSTSMTRGTDNYIKVESKSYLPYTENRYISTDESALTIKLILAQISPLFLIYNEEKLPIEKAAIYINNKLATYSDIYGRAQLQPYTLGITYPLRISAEGYSDWKQDITFDADKTDYIFTLTSLSSPIIITVMSDTNIPLENAQVYIDGVYMGITGSDGTMNIKGDPGKTITISAALDGYVNTSVTTTINQGITTPVTLIMNENFPTTIIVLSSLGGVVIILIGILVFISIRKNRQSISNNGTGNTNSHAPQQRKRDSL